MKPAINMLISISFILMMVLAIVVPVQASTGTGGTSGLFDDNGNLLPGVTDLGEQTITGADWMNLKIGPIDIVPTGHEYVTTDGKTVFVPSTSTLIAMAANPDESGLSNTVGDISVYDPIAAQAIWYGATLGAISGNKDAQAEMASWGTTLLTMNVSDKVKQLISEYDPTNFANDVNKDKTVWSLVNYDIITMVGQLLKTDVNDKDISTLYLTYSSCSASPTGCANNICKLAPQEASCAAAASAAVAKASTSYAGCPASTIVPGTPSYSIYKEAPNDPLVVGQDPNKRGADVGYSAKIPPTVYTYYVAKPVYKTIRVCTVEGGCGTTGASKKLGGRVVSATVLDHVDCEKHVEVYQESITGLGATASLSQESINWINDKLSAYYYRAHTLQTSFNLIPGLASASTYCSNKVCYASGSVTHIQFRDPGTYGLSLVVRTSGTPVTTGRTFSTAGSLTVSFIAVRLIENGSN